MLTYFLLLPASLSTADPNPGSPGRSVPRCERFFSAGPEIPHKRSRSGPRRHRRRRRPHCRLRLFPGLSRQWRTRSKTGANAECRRPLCPESSPSTPATSTPPRPKFRPSANHSQPVWQTIASRSIRRSSKARMARRARKNRRQDRHYIPHNAYLIYGSASALRQMQSWAAQSPYVQWEGRISR